MLEKNELIRASHWCFQFSKRCTIQEVMESKSLYGMGRFVGVWAAGSKLNPLWSFVLNPSFAMSHTSAHHFLLRQRDCSWARDILLGGGPIICQTPPVRGVPRSPQVSPG